MKVDGKVAIVTGGGGGIGGALAEELATHGARVLVADLDAARAQAVADKFNALGRGSAVAAGADVSDTTAIRGLISLAERDFGPVDLYFANAGIRRGTRARGQRRGLGPCDRREPAGPHPGRATADPRLGRARRGLLRQHRVGRRPAHPDRRRPPTP